MSDSLGSTIVRPGRSGTKYDLFGFARQTMYHDIGILESLLCVLLPFVVFWLVILCFCVHDERSMRRMLEQIEKLNRK